MDQGFSQLVFILLSFWNPCCVRSNNLDVLVWGALDCGRLVSRTACFNPNFILII